MDIAMCRRRREMGLVHELQLFHRGRRRTPGVTWMPQDGLLRGSGFSKTVTFHGRKSVSESRVESITY